MEGNELSFLQQELKQLKLELKKTQRQLKTANENIEKFRDTTLAHEKLSAVLTAEKMRQEKYLRLLLENCPDIIMLIDSFGKLVFCTAVFFEIANIPSYKIHGDMHLKELLSLTLDPESYVFIADKFNSAMAEKRNISFDLRIDFSGGGRPRDYSVQATPVLNPDDSIEGMLAIFYDLTDLIREKERAQRANRAKSDFLVTISHEIRTPMNAVIGVSDMLKKTGLNENQSQLLEIIQNSSHVLLGLINDILDFSKIEAGKLELICDYFSISDFFENIENMFAFLFNQKNIEFVCNYAWDLPSTVFGDEKRLTQITSNLLNNALKYTKEGRVTLTVRYEDGKLSFDICDTGIGIREEDMGRLFTAFEQLDLVRNKKIMGTGLGLSITKRLCELMDGSITVSSQYGSGSCFTVEIPLESSSEILPQVEEDEFHRFRAPNARVLIVDDIDINLVIASAILEEYEINPVTSDSGYDALEHVKAEEFDLIFMDHMMPELDGIETVAIIRKFEGYARTVPVIALTANAIEGAEEAFLQNGFSDFISKPIDPLVVNNCLYKWLPKDCIIVENTH